MWTCLLEATKHPDNRPVDCQDCISQSKNKIKGRSIALDSRNQKLQLLSHIQEQHCYLQNSGLAWSNFSYMTPMEESRPLSLVETCSAPLKVCCKYLQRPLQLPSKNITLRTSCLITSKYEDKATPGPWNFLTSGWTRQLHIWGVRRGSSTKRTRRSANHSSCGHKKSNQDHREICQKNDSQQDLS